MGLLRFGCALGTFGLLTWIASSPMIHRWDEWVTVWLQRTAPIPDLPAAMLVLLGNAEVVILGLLLAAIVLWRQDRRRSTAALWLGGGVAVVGLVAVGLKHLIVHPGPPPALQRIVLNAGLQLPTPYSYPSGHTLRTTLLAGTIFRRVPLFAATLVLGMMAALVYLGDHWLSDVLGGLCLGWASVEVAGAVRTARFRNYRRG